MWTTIVETLTPVLSFLAWAFLISGMFGAVNWVFGAITNIAAGQSFSAKKLFKGIGKMLIIFFATGVAAIAVSLLPILNTMTMEVIGTPLISEKIVSSVSMVGIITAIGASITTEATNAIGQIKRFFEQKKTHEDENKSI